MNLRPLNDRVVLKALETEQKTKGGIVLPDSAKEKPQAAQVIAVGEGKLLKDGKRAKSVLKKGDKVIYGKYSGNEIKVAGQEYIITSESEILARLD